VYGPTVLAAPPRSYLFVPSSQGGPPMDLKQFHKLVDSKVVAEEIPYNERHVRAFFADTVYTTTIPDWDTYSEDDETLLKRQIKRVSVATSKLATMETKTSMAPTDLYVGSSSKQIQFEAIDDQPMSRTLPMLTESFGREYQNEHLRRSESSLLQSNTRKK
jgi:hypothetical protein